MSTMTKAKGKAQAKSDGVSCAVFVEGGDEDAVTEALLAKLRDILTRLNMWRDELEADYRKLVIDDRETQAIWAGKRCGDAKRAAVTRRRNKETAAEAVKMGIRGVEEELQNETFD
jgi:hypothetical protein